MRVDLQAGFLWFLVCMGTVSCWAGDKELFVPKVPLLAGSRIVTDSSVLRRAAVDALKYFKGKRSVTRSSVLESLGIGAADVENTLRSIIKIIDEDAGKPYNRMLDTAFLTRRFKFVQWRGDAVAAKKAGVVIPPGPDAGELRDGRIRITSYAIFTVNGSYERTERCNTPLYSLSRFKIDHKVQGRAKLVSDDSGAFHKLRPLVWLPEAYADDALMQGSVVVKMPDNRQRVFNVHRRLALKQTPQSESQGLWLFREVFDVNGTNGGPHLRIMNHGGALFAGDLQNLGLGKIIALQYKNPMTRKHEIRLGVLADSGEAFKDNLYQLDIYAGIFDSRNEFKKQLKNLANTAHAYFLIAK